jgi:hypothetical protein
MPPIMIAIRMRPLVIVMAKIKKAKSNAHLIGVNI